MGKRGIESKDQLLVGTLKDWCVLRYGKPSGKTSISSLRPLDKEEPVPLK